MDLNIWENIVLYDEVGIHSFNNYLLESYLMQTCNTQNSTLRCKQILMKKKNKKAINKIYNISDSDHCY